MGSLTATPVAVGLSLLFSSPLGIVTFFKWIVACGCIVFQRWKRKKRLELYDYGATHDPEKLNFLPPQIEHDLESPQPESHLLQAADEVFFYGVNSDGERLVARVSRTVNHESEACLCLKLKDGRTYRMEETSGYQNSCSDTGRDFTCGALRLSYIKPMRRWRIFYNGVLRETSEVDDTVNRMVYAKLAFIWIASSDCFDGTTDINGVSLAMGLAKSKWKTFMPPLEILNQSTNFYAQSGNIMGTIQVETDTEERVLFFLGERVRFLGNGSLKRGAQLTHILGEISKTGCIFHVAESSIPGVVSKLKFGFVVLPSGVLCPISDPCMHLESENKQAFRAIFHADGLEFDVKAKLSVKQARLVNREGSDGSLTISSFEFEISDGLKGSGVLVKRVITEPPARITLESCGKISLEDFPVAVHFTENLCERSEVTGGKGSSLGKLTQLSKDWQNFIVPNGIVVTTSAYEKFLNDAIRRRVKDLEDVLYGKIKGDVKEASNKVMEEVIAAKMPDLVFKGVVGCLQKAFGDGLLSKKFAVRSSATGEDTEQMSAAGQMDTFLGVSGLDEIILAVQKCWASQFGFVATQYKRQNGQVINSPMAVVIQEMISCDVAGVLFTCDPLTGNPQLMSITANYGLGESVVSGSEEPDAIILERYPDDQLGIKNKMIGAKTRRIVINDDAGTASEEVSQSEKDSCCLSDAQVLRLGNLAAQIEKSYRSSRDIEWGFWNNNLYIFQSRPITSGTGETDFEIDHDSDCPMRTERDYVTVANLGEVMPGALTPLGLDLTFKHFAITFKRRMLTAWQTSVRGNYFPKGLCHFYNHAMFYSIDIMERIGEGREAVEPSMVALYGRIIDDEEMYETAVERYGRKKKDSLYEKCCRLYRDLFDFTRRLKKTQEHYVNYRIPTERLKTSHQTFDALMHACDDLDKAFMCHMVATNGSTIWNMMVISILEKAKGGISNEVYAEFAKLLSSIKQLESADVPSAMESLAYHIGKHIDPEELKKMKCGEIAEWLKTCSNGAGEKFREFLSKHGHRCLKEFDVFSTAWESNPSLFIELLKNLVGNVKDASQKTSKGTDEILADLQLTFLQRLVLKFMLPWCRAAVQAREGAKSVLIKGTDCWRKGYRHLAKLMVSEGRIPDEDLLFFMPLEEIQELLRSRSPKIISRANHRRRRYPELDRYIFPEIIKGPPHPVNLNNSPVTPAEDNFMMKGIPVSQGVARGFVRVVFTLEEASELKPGEILLTYSTDIGWSPYFPALAGVVTELGGLISHGAVVSREYGLPCIAGLHGATRQFQTGDYVLLDGNTGILQKIAPPENQ